MTEEDRDAAEADRAAAELGRVEAEEDRVDAEAGDGGVALELGRVQAEEARVEAEVEREQHEVRRRIAEGGPDQHVPGNVETGRVEAEEKRQQNARKLYGRVAALIALPLAFVSLIPSVVGLVLLKREVDNRCRDSAVNRTAIRGSVVDSLSALGYIYKDGKVVPHGKPLAYYLEYPDERAQVLQNTRATLDRFPPISCT